LLRLLRSPAKSVRMLAKRISDLLKSRTPAALCDRCIAAELGASSSRVRQVTEVFGITSDFTRVPAHCPGCGEQAWTIRAGGTE
jgi:hypothetical protein